MEINDVLSRLRKVKRSGDGWVACCPAHPDTTPSLSIKQGDNGTILFHCFTGCSFVQIVQALELDEREHSMSEAKTKNQNVKNCIVAEYDYADESGEILYQMVRLEPKKFVARKPNEKGGWDWTIKGCRKVLYRLPEILAARENDSFIIFCEGEKDVNNVRTKLDFPATTCAFGAGAWNDDYADSLFGTNVIILPDNDKTGKEFSEVVANSIYGKAQSVRIIELPDLAEKGDVSDWIDNGGSREQLIELIERTAEWQPIRKVKDSVSSNQTFFTIKPASEWIEQAKKTPVPKMLFGELWFEGEICFLFADTNVGKSILAVQVADSITNGKQIGSFPLEVESQKVLYFDFELNEKQFSKRYAQNVDGYLQDEYQFNPNFFRVTLNPNRNQLDDNFEKKLFESLEASIVESGAKIIIVDNLTYLKTNLEKAKEALPLMQHLKMLKEKYNLSILVLGHTTKRYLDKEITQNDLAGSKMLMNFCDSSFSIGKSSKDDKIRYVKQIKVRNTELIYGRDNVVVFQIQKPGNFLSFEFLSIGSETEHLKVLTEKDKEQLYRDVAELVAQNMSYREIAEIKGISVGSVHNYFKKASELINPTDTLVEDFQNVHPLFDMNNLNTMNNAEEAEKPIQIFSFDEFDNSEPYGELSIKE